MLAVPIFTLSDIVIFPEILIKTKKTDKTLAEINSYDKIN